MITSSNQAMQSIGRAYLKKKNRTTKTNPYVIGASEPGVLAHTYNPSMKKD